MKVKNLKMWLLLAACAVALTWAAYQFLPSDTQPADGTQPTTMEETADPAESVPIEAEDVEIPKEQE